MFERILKYLSVLFVILWSLVVFSEYWHYNHYYGLAFQHFQQTDLLITFVLIAALTSWGAHRARKKKSPLKFINGLSVFLFILFLDIVTLIIYDNKTNAIDLTSNSAASHIGHFIGVASCVFLIYLVCRVLGDMITFLFSPKIATVDMPVIQTAIGIMLITFLLFLLGLFKLLYFFVIAPILLAILLFNWKVTLQIIKSTLLKPLRIRGSLNAVGVFSFLFLGIFLVFDFVQILRPFPIGTDSINLYVNLPTLINDYSGLVAGHQPYNWSLFMSLGLVVFKRVDVLLALSFFGGFMALRTLYQLARKWLDPNFAALALLLFFSVPLANFLSYMDMKIDMGLLYIVLCTVLLFVNWVSPPDLLKPKKKTTKSLLVKSSSKNKKAKNVKPSVPVFSYLLGLKSFLNKHVPAVFIENRLIVLIGVFAGFALGIKLTTLFLFFAIIAAIWYAEGGIWHFLSAFFLTMGATFLLQLDGQAVLRHLHLSVIPTQWILIIIGLSMVAFLYTKNNTKIMQLLKLSTILSLFFVLPMLPWLGKNFMETKSFSSDALLNGMKAEPKINLNTLENNWKKLYE